MDAHALTRSALLLASTVVLAACATRPGPATLASCEGDFDRFLTRFETDRKFQEGNTADPLRFEGVARTRCGVDCSSETRQMSLTMQALRSKAQPLYPLVATQRQQKLESRVKVSGSTAAVEVYLPDSDAYHMDFRFSRTGGACWRLDRVKDTSI